MNLVILDEKGEVKMYYFIGGIAIGALTGVTMDFGIKSAVVTLLLSFLWALLGIKIEKEYRRAIK